MSDFRPGEPVFYGNPTVAGHAAYVGPNTEDTSIVRLPSGHYEIPVRTEELEPVTWIAGQAESRRHEGMFGVFVRDGGQLLGAVTDPYSKVEVGWVAGGVPAHAIEVLAVCPRHHDVAERHCTCTGPLVGLEG